MTRHLDLEAHVGANVRRLRAATGISQQRLGAALASHGFPMHQATVAKLEAGTKPLRLNEVCALASYFGVPLEDMWATGTLPLVALQRLANPEWGDSRQITRMVAASGGCAR